MAGGLALAAHAALEEPALGLFGAAGATVLAMALLSGRAGLVAPALILVAVGYAATLVARDVNALDPAAPLVACALLLVAELAYWSVELASSVRAEPRVLLGRLAALVGLAATALALAAGVLAATAIPLGGGLVWNLAGMTAAAGAIALIAELSRRSGAGVEPTQPGDSRPHWF